MFGFTNSVYFIGTNDAGLVAFLYLDKFVWHVDYRREHIVQLISFSYLKFINIVQPMYEK